MVPDDVNELLTGLQRDLAPTGLRHAAAVYDLARGAWLSSCYLPEPSGFGESGYVLCNPKVQHALQLDADGTPSGTDIVAALQMWAIEELGRPWPEAYEGGQRYLGLLQPGQDADGDVCWQLKGRNVTPVGYLEDLLLPLAGLTTGEA